MASKRRPLLRRFAERLGVVKKPIPWHQRRDVWTTKAGYVVRLRDLEDSHLANIIPFLYRRAAQWKQKAMADMMATSCMLMGEHAIDAIESEMAILEDKTPLDLLQDLPIFQALCEEADRRAAAQGFVPALGEFDPVAYRQGERVFSDSEEDGGMRWDKADDPGGMLVRW